MELERHPSGWLVTVQTRCVWNRMGLLDATHRALQDLLWGSPCTAAAAPGRRPPDPAGSHAVLTDIWGLHLIPDHSAKQADCESIVQFNSVF